MEKFTFQYSLVSKNPGNKVERLYSRHARNLEKVLRDARHQKFLASNANKVFIELEKELKEILPGREEFEENFKDLRYVNSPGGRMKTKYILGKIDRYFNPTDEQKIDFDKTNAEHILPQNPIKWNLEKADVRNYVNSLGNITLLDSKLNSKAGNKTPQEKIVFLGESQLRINEDLLRNYDILNWGEDSIENRQKSLCKIAYEEVWKI